MDAVPTSTFASPSPYPATRSVPHLATGPTTRPTARAAVRPAPRTRARTSTTPSRRLSPVLDVVEHRAAPVLATAAVGLLAARRLRRWMAEWGSTSVETLRDIPGDELIPNPVMGVTRSITVAAPASAVWPWIAQIGASDLGRAGWYSYDRLDNGGVPSADHLLGIPEPEVGDRLVSDPDFAWTVRAVVPGESLVLDIAPPGRLRVHATFAFLLEPLPDGRCRLVERSWWDVHPRWAGTPFSVLFEPIDFVMMRKHLITVRDRAEAAYRDSA